jgi:hypothetical protein
MQHKSISNARQGSLGFYLPRPLGTGEFREACSLWVGEARSAAGISADDANGIFNHSADGRPRNHLSPYRFATDGNWGLVHALGDEAVGVLKKLADVAMSSPRLPALFATPQWEDRNVGVELDGEQVSYWLPDMIVCRNAEQHARWNKSTRTEKAAHVQDLLDRGIRRQLELLGLQVELPQVSVVEIKRERAVPKLRKTPANAYVRVATTAFTMGARLHGHWAAGSLINRGYGSIVAMSPVAKA